MPIRIDELNLQRQLEQELIKSKTNAQTSDKSFIDTLKQMIEDVDKLHKESVEKQEDFIKGEPVDIHEVMITAEKAKTSFQLLTEIRNRFLDLYREIIRMQV